MASDISLGEQYLWVANQRLSSLITFVLGVGSDIAATDQEREYVARLKKWDDEQHYPGCGFDLHERFPTIEEKKFWSRCFLTVARRIFRREVGNQDIHFWQCSAIADAYITARMMTNAVRKETDTPWCPDTEDAAEAQEYYDRINIQL